MKQQQKITIFWFRRDLRLVDNRGLHEALKSSYPVLPLFIFDTEITEELEKDDPRITFIYDSISAISKSLNEHSSSVFCKKGKPLDIWKQILYNFDLHAVFANEDYEPYAIKRDKAVSNLLSEKGIPFYLFKDQVIFAKNDVLKNDNTPYTVFTPYKNKWLEKLNNETLFEYPVNRWTHYANFKFDFPDMSDLGFERSAIEVRDYKLDQLDNYTETRNYPAVEGTSDLSPHLRFGTVSIREILKKTLPNQIFVSELIWREFFMQILFHFPEVVHRNFKSKYDHIKWRNNQAEFERWKNGETGYPLVDAGIRELNSTGYMHNRVRMVVAGFLCKHLLIDWRWGEAYFAGKLLDYELSSNNGNWQWSAGTGCDAAPYFRVFNPGEQVKKFDPKLVYIKKWIRELDTPAYPSPIVEHKFARDRAIATYKAGLNLK